MDRRLIPTVGIRVLVSEAAIKECFYDFLYKAGFYEGNTDASGQAVACDYLLNGTRSMVVNPTLILHDTRMFTIIFYDDDNCVLFAYRQRGGSSLRASIVMTRMRSPMAN